MSKSELSQRQTKSLTTEVPTSQNHEDGQTEQTGQTERKVSVNHARLYLACQEKDRESPVRRKSHLKKLALAKWKKQIRSDLMMIKYSSASLLDNHKISKSENNLEAKSSEELHSEEICEFDKGLDLNDTTPCDGKTDTKKDMEESKRKRKKSVRPLSTFKKFLQNNIHFLSPLEAAVVIAVFDKTIDQLAVLKQLLPTYNEKEELLGYKSLKERFCSKNEVFDVDEKLENEDLVKLQKERTFIERVLLRTTRDLHYEQHYWTLYSAVQNIEKMIVDEIEVRRRWHVLRSRLLTLVALLRKERAAARQSQQAQQLVLRAFREQDRLREARLELEARARYVEGWEAARRAQQVRLFARRESQVEEQVRRRRREVQDERLAARSARAVALAEEDRLKEQLSRWEERHAVDSERMAAAQEQARAALQAARDHTQPLADEVSRRASELRRWRSVRAAERRRATAATRLQRWWRALRFRRLVALCCALLRADRRRAQADAQALQEAPTGVAQRGLRQQLAQDAKRHRGGRMLRAYAVFRALMCGGDDETVLRALAAGKGAAKDGPKGVAKGAGKGARGGSAGSKKAGNK